MGWPATARQRAVRVRASQRRVAGVQLGFCLGAFNDLPGAGGNWMRVRPRCENEARNVPAGVRMGAVIISIADSRSSYVPLCGTSEDE